MADARDVKVTVTSRDEIAQATAHGAQSALEASARLAASFSCPNGCPACAFTFARDVIVEGIRKIRIHVAVEVVNHSDLN